VHFQPLLGQSGVGKFSMLDLINATNCCPFAVYRSVRLVFILIAKSFFLLTSYPTLSHKGRGELEEKTFGKRYNLSIGRTHAIIAAICR
jgi:hypothetical protein